jgi:S1-C subfamily serine protease
MSTFLHRTLILAALVAMGPHAATAQTLVVVHIRITLADGTNAAVPIARHALLISDNPATSAPRRVVTGPAGTVDVSLRPGNYTFESDEPLAFNGKGYQWTRTLDVPGGRDLVLELTAANADVVAAPALSSSTAPDNDPSLLFAQWKDSVVAVWTPESRGSGFLVSADGLVVTSQRNINNSGYSGAAVPAEVQFSASVKVEARVLVADRTRDLAVLWIDPGVASVSKPIPLGCDAASRPSFAVGQKLVAIGAPFRGDKELSPGNVITADSHASVADFRLARGSTGGPVFVSTGAVAGVSSLVDGEDERSRRDARVVSVDDVCAAVASAKAAMRGAAKPAAARLPVEPARPFPAGALAAQAGRRAGSLNPYRVSSSDFDVSFLTPVMVYNAMNNTKARPAPETDFGDWSDYFGDAPAVLVMRVTPKQTESFWTTVARGAAATQGAILPPIKHFKPGFARLRAYCGESEVVPIHPFTVARRVSETDGVREGLYVFDAQAFGPHCTSVKLVLSSEKASAKQDITTVDPKILQQIHDDFAAWRSAE